MKISLEDYKRKKGLIPENNYGTLFVFHSNRNGVSEISEHIIWDFFHSGNRINPKPECKTYTYILKESPYRVSIDEDQEIGCEIHLFTGIGDCWSGSTFCSKDKYLLEKARHEELETIKKKYHEKLD